MTQIPASGNQDAVLRGVNKLADTVKATLGPKGQGVIIQTGVDAPTVTKDGFIVTKKTVLSDPQEDMGALMVREVAGKTWEVVGDGTTTASLLARAIYREGAKRVAAGANAVKVQQGIKLAIQAAVKAIDKLAKPVQGEDLVHVGTLAADGDEEVGRLVAKALEHAGKNGVILVKESAGLETRLWMQKAEPVKGAVIWVGGADEATRQEKKTRVQHALNAARAAVAEGVVPGGGVALLRAVRAVEGIQAQGDIGVGVQIVRRALEEPARQIALNAGKKGAATVRKLLATSGDTGYNARTDKFEDLIAAGVIDPAKVTKTALLNAASIFKPPLNVTGISKGAPRAPREYRSSGHTFHVRDSGGSGFQSVSKSELPTRGLAEETEGSPPEAASPLDSGGELKAAGPGGDGGDPPEKQISVWVSEQEKEPERPLRTDEMVTLNFKVGQPVSASLVAGPATRVPLADIPEEGLPTEWVISSKTLLLVPGTPGTEVKSERVGGSILWQASFSLLIPREGDSGVAQLKALPQSAEGAWLDVLVYARGVLYRRLEVELRLEPGPQRAAAPAPVASIQSQMTYYLPGEIGRQPTQAWALPPGLGLGINVGRDETHFSGKVVTRTGPWEPNRWVQWPPQKAELADLILQLRQAAEEFREDCQSYLDDIPAEDFERRLQDLSQTPGDLPRDWDRLPDIADESHRQAWEEVAFNPKLRNLAFQGYALYQALFEIPFQELPEIRSGLSGMLPGSYININWHNTIGETWTTHVPWGLLYQEEPSLERPIDPMKFLGLRYRIGYVPYHATMPHGALGRPDSVWAAHCLYWGTNDSAGTEAQWQRARWSRWPNQVIVPMDPAEREAKAGIRRLLTAPEKTPMAVLYFFCRSAEGSGKNDLVLRFGNSSREEDNLRQQDLGLQKLADRPFVFANACATAAADPYIANRLELTFIKNRGCRAFLGTETKVPIVLASRFAAVFFHFFFRQVGGEPVSAGEAVAQARLFLWTHYRNLGGLFYCLVNKYGLYMADEQEIQALP